MWWFSGQKHLLRVLLSFNSQLDSLELSEGKALVEKLPKSCWSERKPWLSNCLNLVGLKEKPWVEELPRSGWPVGMRYPLDC